MLSTPVWALCIVLVAFSEAKVLQKAGEAKKRAGDGDATKTTTTPPPAALDGEGKLTETTMKKLLSETNKYRLMHDASPLGNCPVCSEAAQKHVDVIATSGIVKPDHKSKYGQIIFSTKDAQDISQGADYFGTLVPARIYNQIKNYDFVKNEFKDNGADFSQLVWEGSEVIGYASKKAADETVYVVIYFNPPGNNDTSSYFENVNRVTGAGDVDQSGRTKCPDGWQINGANCWKYFEDEMAWGDAADHCNVLKASLTSAENMDEGTFIRTLLMEKEKPAWIGMSDTAMKGGFQFVDGTPYVYSDWSYDSYQWLYAHPGDARSKCIDAGKDGWNYKECTDKLAFICKLRPNGVTSYALDLYFPGSSFTDDLAQQGSQRYNLLKSNIDKAFNSSYGTDMWFVGATFYQFMPRDNGEVAASTLVKFAPDVRAPVDPISKLREYLRGQSDMKILAVRLIPGMGRVTQPVVTGGTCPSGCSGDCYPECNPGCCGATVSLSAPMVASGFTACPQYAGCGTTCQPSCSQSCCQQNQYQPMQQQQCPQYPGCRASCAPSCTQSCCQQQQQQPMQMMQAPTQQACPQSPGCSASCAPSCTQSCCQQQQQQQQPMQMVQAPMQQACPQSPGCSASCAPRCSQSCCQQQQQQQPMQMMQAPMQQACPQMPGCSASCAPSCTQSCCQQQRQQPMQMQMLQAPTQQACPQMPGCSASCAPRCTQSCCQQQQQQPIMMPQQPMQQACPQMPGCSASCAPQCTQSCCQQQQMQQQPIMIQPMMIAPQPQNACSAQFPGCSSACAPVCRPRCCSGTGMRSMLGKKRSKVGKSHSKKRTVHHKKNSKVDLKDKSNIHS